MGPLGKALGMGAKKPVPGADEEEGEDYSEPSSLEEPAEEESSGVPPEFQSAYDEYSAAPSAESMYAMIEACKSGGSEKPGGLALILGGKGKK